MADVNDTRMTTKTAPKIGAEVAYLLYDRNIFGRPRNLIGVYARADDCLAAIGTYWRSAPKQRLYAAYSNGMLREIKQTGELVKFIDAPSPSIEPPTGF